MITGNLPASVMEEYINIKVIVTGSINTAYTSHL
jgi:hypothetical protein